MPLIMGMTIEVGGPYPKSIALHEKQIIYLTAKPEARFRGAIAGRQGGKTLIGNIAFIQEVEKWKRETFVLAAPTFPMLVQASKLTFDELYGHNIVKWDKVHNVGFDRRGNRIFFRSADDPDKMRGITARAVLLDEAAYMKKEVFAIAKACVATTQGNIFLTTTPKGANWIKTDLIDKRNDPEYFIVRWRSPENPAFPMKEYEERRREMNPAWFRQEYDAEITVMGGLVHPEFTREIHMHPCEYQKDLPLYWGMDFGINFPTFIGMYQIDFAFENPDTRALMTQIRKVNELWRTGRRVELVVQEALDMYGRKPQFVCCDPTGRHRDLVAGYGAVDVLRRDFKLILRYKKDWNYKEQRIKAIAKINRSLATPHELLIDPKCVKTIEGFENYEHDEHDEMPLKDGVHDHPMEETQYFYLGKPNVRISNDYYVERLEMFEGTGV